MAFVYDATKMDILDEVGEVALPPSDYRYVTLPGSSKGSTASIGTRTSRASAPDRSPSPS